MPSRDPPYIAEHLAKERFVVERHQSTTIVALDAVQEL